MYFRGELAIDPSKITTIRNVKPVKIFKKLMNALTLGITSEKEEQETFTAVAILQQLNGSLRAAGINNIIRLAVDDQDLYFDTKGRENDLDDAMVQMEVKLDPIESEGFNGIYLVLEHEQDQLKYVIEISIEKTHPVGEFPIKIVLNGILSEFKSKAGESRESLEKRMEPIFKDQSVYDHFLEKKNLEFNHFVEQLALAVRKFIKTDEIINNCSKQMIRPKERVESVAHIKPVKGGQPAYYGYYGLDDYMFYSYFWSHSCYSHNLYCHDFSLVDTSGSTIMDVGETGFNANETNALNENADFEAPAGGDLTYHGDNEFQSDLESLDGYSDGGADEVDSGSGWLSGGGDSDGDTSSCSSCSSCGGCD